jgi:hypothetical protein
MALSVCSTTIAALHVQPADMRLFDATLPRPEAQRFGSC